LPEGRKGVSGGRRGKGAEGDRRLGRNGNNNSVNRARFVASLASLARSLARADNSSNTFFLPRNSYLVSPLAKSKIPPPRILSRIRTSLFLSLFLSFSLSLSLSLSDLSRRQMSILLFKEMLLPALVRNINRHRGLTRAYDTDRALYRFSLSLFLSFHVASDYLYVRAANSFPSPSFPNERDRDRDKEKERERKERDRELAVEDLRCFRSATTRSRFIAHSPSTPLY